jgi:transcriptional regulator of acetoin/glycerol metabolism
MATASAEDIRKKLRDLGARRKRQVREDEKLTGEIKKALAAAEGKISVSEQADLLEMHRTTLYRVYK